MHSNLINFIKYFHHYSNNDSKNSLFIHSSSTSVFVQVFCSKKHIVGTPFNLNFG